MGSESDITLALGFRDRVAAVLECFLSDSFFDSARWRVEPATRISGLLELWYGKVYIPASSYLDEIKGDQDPQMVESFMADFDDEELEYIERFHGFLDLRLDMLGPNSPQTLRGSSGWNQVQKDARYALEQLQPDRDEQEQRARWVVREVELISDRG